MLKIIKKRNEVKLADGRSLFLVSHSGCNGWSKDTRDALQRAIDQGEDLGQTLEGEYGIAFQTFSRDIWIIGVFKQSFDCSWSRKTRAYSPSWYKEFLGLPSDDL